MFTNATDGLDVDFDIPTPPAAPSNYIEVYFPHTEWSGTVLGPNYIRDYKARVDLSVTTSTWTFDVKTDKTGDVTISKDVFVNVPDNYNITIKDLSTMTITDLRTSSYTYTILPSENVRSFELTIGVTLSNPTIVVDPTALSFGTVKTDASKAMGVLIKNTGDQPLNITNMVVDGSIHYSFEGNTTATLNKDDTTTVFVRFHPKTAGTLTGTLTITSNDPVNGSLVVNLTGNGQSLSPNILVRTDSLNFGAVITGGTSDLVIFVGNTGDTTLTVSSVVVAGTGFSNLGLSDFSVAVGDSNGLSIRFSPLTVGDFSGTLTFTSDDPDTPTLVVTLTGRGTTTTLTNEFGAGWNLMSIPVLPSSNLASDIIGDDIASFILYGYSGGIYQSSPTLDPTMGYWLGIESITTVDLEGTLILTDQTKALAGGWNLIATPFTAGSQKTNLRILQGENTYTIEEAVTAGLVQSTIYKYETSTKQYEAVTYLAPWYGNWFFTIQPGLSLKYLIAAPADVISPKKNELFEITPSNWFVDILSEMNGIKDKYLSFGTNEAATDGFDNSFDYVKAPISPAANAIESYFLQSSWTNFATRFASNIQAPLLNGVNKSWSFKVYAKSAGTFKISWLDILNRIPQEIRNVYTFTLRGPGISSGINMLTQTVYEFNVTAGGTYSFVINSSPVGVEDELMNLSFKLGQNYPNPFNPSTTINYAIKETGLVTLKIYDVLGNEVVTLVNDIKQPGQYEAKFEASNLPSGTYIYKLVQGNNSEIKKLMLLK
jgi:archaellum component FlaG (FlaF/FlaG flagellin family)